jgi:hypothetical protein
MTHDTEKTDPTAAMPGQAERRAATPTPERLASVEAVLADGELTPPQKLDLLSAWDGRHGTARAQGYGRVADAADLGFPDPSPYSPEVQTAMVELYRRHRDDLPPPDASARPSDAR